MIFCNAAAHLLDHNGGGLVQCYSTQSIGCPGLPQFAVKPLGIYCTLAGNITETLSPEKKKNLPLGIWVLVFFYHLRVKF